MSVYLYAFSILLVFYIVGAGFLKLVNKVSKKTTAQPTEIVFLIGIAIIICFSQLGSLFTSTSVLAVVWWIIILIIILWLEKELFIGLWKYLKEHKWFVIGMFGAFSIWAFPMLKVNELFSMQYANNDIIYYLSTMDWLVDHSLLQEVTYTDASPYFLCAEYIFSTTRFGTDVLGSLLMQMFGLQAHEIFSFLGIIGILLAGHGIYHLLKNVLKVSKKCSTIISFVVLMNSNWRELLLLQYVPQILGIVFLIMFIANVTDYFGNGKKETLMIASLSLVATASVYSEFASYMFIIYLGSVLIQCIASREWWKTAKDAFKIGILAIIFNPLGFWVAIKFNLNILMQVSESPSNIDAYGGNIMLIRDVLGQLLGAPNASTFADNGAVFKAYFYFLVLFFCVSLGIIAYLLLKKNTTNNMFVSWILLFFAGYEMYFHSVRLAYGEYKHLLGVAVIFATLLLYFVYEFSKNKKHKILLGIVLVMLLLLNYVSVKTTYPEKDIAKYNHTLEEIEEGIALIPSGDCVGILGNMHYQQHLLIYAAKNYSVQLMGEGINSYYAMLGMELNNEIPKYILCMNNAVELDTVLHGNYEEVWKNESYMIIKKQLVE